jgi:hypothetical protein
MGTSGQHSPNVGAGFFLVRDEALRLLILDYGEQEGFIAPQRRRGRKGKMNIEHNVQHRMLNEKEKKNDERRTIE